MQVRRLGRGVLVNALLFKLVLFDLMFAASESTVLCIFVVIGALLPGILLGLLPHVTMFVNT